MSVRRLHLMLALMSLALAACSLAVAPGGGPPTEACVPPGSWVTLGPDGPLRQPTDRILARLAERRVVLLGETHDDAEHHRWQLSTLAGLHALRPRMLLGFEMFPRRVQPALDQWVAGRLTDQEFLRQADWATVWGYDPRLYLPLFHFARMHRIPMRALNVERSLVRRVGDEGWAAIPPSLREGVGDPAPAGPEYTRLLFRSYLDHQAPGGGGDREARSPSQAELEDPKFRRFVEAMLVWDRAMAEGLAGGLAREPETLVVAILGSGHLRHGHGVPRQLRALGVPEVAVALPWGRSEACADLRAGLADALFGVEHRPEPPAPDRPRLGITLDRGTEGVLIREVTAGSLAEQAGLRPGDLILAIAGRPARELEDVIGAVRRTAAGTWLPLQVRRGGETLEIVARFPAQP